eukprot:evm.model.scf_1570.1 EVM.evm.TU.scf_1570.1   scf_1570:5778-9080(+)
MKTAQALVLAVALLAAAGFASAIRTSRRLHEVTVVSNLDPLDTYDVVEDSGRTFVRVVDSPFFGKAAEADGTVFGRVFGSVAQMIQSAIAGTATVGEVIIKNNGR